MFSLGDLFQWDRFITTTIIKPFYWLAVIIAVMVGVSGLMSALELMTARPLAGILLAIASVAGVLVGIMAARIVAEFVLVVFRINEHLSAIRHQRER